MSTVTQIKKQPQTLGAKIDALFELREQKRALNKELDGLKEDMSNLENAILSDLDNQDTTMSRGSRATVSISETDIPVIENPGDWDTIHQFIKDNDAMYLLERRLSTAAWREMRNAGTPIPGTKSFTRRSLSLRKV